MKMTQALTVVAATFAAAICYVPSLLAQSSEQDSRVNGWYFVFEVQREGKCAISNYFAIEKVRGGQETYPPQITSYSIEAELVYRDGRRIYFPGGSNYLSRGAIGGGSFSIRCDQFHYIEVTEATCKVNYLGQAGDIETAETFSNDECLGKMPQRVFSIGRFTPEKASLLLPLAPPLPTD